MWPTIRHDHAIDGNGFTVFISKRSKMLFVSRVHDVDISLRIVGGDPHAANIIDVTFVGFDVTVLGKDDIFIDGKIQGGIVASRWCAHCSATELVPICVTETKEV